MRLVFFDIETGGLDALRHPITQLAAVAVDSQLHELDTFEVKIDFDRSKADPDALLKNSYDHAVWQREQVRPAEVINRFTAFLRDYCDVECVSKRTGNPYRVAQVVGHNAATFDYPFLAALYGQHKAFLLAYPRVMDTCQRAIWWFHERPEIAQPENFQLGTLAKYFGIPLDNAHDALADVRATVELCRVLTKVEAKAAA